MRGNQCIYVCADDAHGSAIMLRAEKEGITPEQLIANVQAEQRRLRRLPGGLRQLPLHSRRRKP
jgi:methionyl-tRNA synthetase